MNADGTQQTQLTKSPVAERDPAWSPNGRQITFVVGNQDDITSYLVGVNASVIQCVLALVSLCVPLIGLVVSLSLALGPRSAPRKWPRFYRWIDRWNESHATMRAVEPGAIAGVLAALIGLGITISSHSLTEHGFVELVLGGYFIIVLAMFPIGSVVGAVGGIVGGIIANRFGGKTAIIFVAAVFGGAIAGLVIGILPNALGWLTP